MKKSEWSTKEIVHFWEKDDGTIVRDRISCFPTALVKAKPSLKPPAKPSPLSESIAAMKKLFNSVFLAK